MGGARALQRMSAAGAQKATLNWLQRFVVGLGLCPWARPQHTLVAVAPCHAGVEGGVRFMRRQAQLLALGTAGLYRGVEQPTCVCVFTDASYADPVSFAGLWRTVEADLDASLILLAFHPLRVDHGPGCLPQIASDAGHFSVRAPWPTLQLLRVADVLAAREHWAEAHGGPGAFGLLTANKRKLRSTGTPRLQEMINTCRTDTALDSDITLVEDDVHVPRSI
ncbi:hypothetical protein T492DRAFT_956913 [Pavlovales sp. CCMP2436]|nr:hypothetical protein T492DRAFT_956913 [Pavlovales sp. CCMP2436]